LTDLIGFARSPLRRRHEIGPPAACASLSRDGSRGLPDGQTSSCLTLPAPALSRFCRLDELGLAAVRAAHGHAARSAGPELLHGDPVQLLVTTSFEFLGTVIGVGLRIEHRDLCTIAMIVLSPDDPPSGRPVHLHVVIVDHAVPSHGRTEMPRRACRCRHGWRPESGGCGERCGRGCSGGRLPRVGGLFAGFWSRATPLRVMGDLAALMPVPSPGPLIQPEWCRSPGHPRTDGDHRETGCTVVVRASTVPWC